jgi:xanthine dehydrogenase accessory factor
MLDHILVLVKGAGDLATGVIHRLHRAGMRVVATELPQPLVIRRAVAFASAVYKETWEVEGTVACRVADEGTMDRVLAAGKIPVWVDPQAQILQWLHPDAVVDAIMAKRNTGTTIADAPAVVALGPGFTAGQDCHAVIETNRGHDLGRVILHGQAQANTGLPGKVGGESVQRVLRAPSGGLFEGQRAIGDLVQAGEAMAKVAGQPVVARIGGVLRGLLHSGVFVHAGAKVGDVDPRAVVEHCFTISDKARAIGGSVLEVILYQLSRPSSAQQPRT